MTEQLLKYILFRIQERAREAARESDAEPEDFSGRAAVWPSMKCWICSVQNWMPMKSMSQGLAWKI